MSPPRALLAAAALLAGCAAKHQAPPLAVPELDPEEEYETLELLLSEEPSGRTLAERSPIAPAE